MHVRPFSSARSPQSSGDQQLAHALPRQFQPVRFRQFLMGQRRTEVRTPAPAAGRGSAPGPIPPPVCELRCSAGCCSDARGASKLTPPPPPGDNCANSRFTCRTLTPSCSAAARCFIRFSASRCNTSNRPISRLLMLSSLSTFCPPLGRKELRIPKRGHFNFAQRGLYYFALTQGQLHLANARGNL